MSDATGPYYHGTRADLTPGDLLAPGCALHSFASASDHADRKL